MHLCVQVVFDLSGRLQVVIHEVDSSVSIPRTDQMKVTGNFLTVAIALVLLAELSAV